MAQTERVNVCYNIKNNNENSLWIISLVYLLSVAFVESYYTDI